MKINPVNITTIKASFKNQKISDKNFKNIETTFKTPSVENYKATYFTGGYHPVVAIDMKTGKTQIFRNRIEVQRKLNLPKGYIYRVINEKNGCFGNYFFAEYNKIQQKDKNGNFVFDDNGKIAIDKNKVWEMITNNIFCSINLKTGEVKKFSSLSEAAEELGIKYANINACISGVSKRTGEYIFAPYSILQLKDDEDKIVFDENDVPKINQNKIWKLIGSHTFYAINKKTREIQTFIIQSEASKKLNVSPMLISRVLNGYSGTSCDYVFTYCWKIWAKDENENIIFDENGLPKIDEEKFNKILT